MFLRHILDGNDVPAGFVKHIDHLRQTWRIRHYKVIGKQNGERFVPDQFTRTPDGVAQSERVLLPCVGDTPGFENRIKPYEGFWIRLLESSGANGFQGLEVPLSEE